MPYGVDDDRDADGEYKDDDKEDDDREDGSGCVLACPCTYIWIE